MKKTIAALLIVLQLGLPALAQEIYEGIAVQGRSGEFPSEGYYAASNSFPRNTLVEFTNPSNGKTIEVLITDRISDPGIFVILSDEAAAELGVTSSNAISLTARSVSSTRIGQTTGSQDLPFSSDPEVNPEAEFSDPNAFLFDPDADVPETANPLLDDRPLASQNIDQAEEREVAQGDENDASAATETLESSEPVELSADQGQVLAEDMESPEIEDLFAQNEPLFEEDEEAIQEEQSEPLAEESGPSIAVDSKSPESDEQAQDSESASNIGVSQGIGEVASQPEVQGQNATGTQAQRSGQTSSRGILSALSQIRRGTNAVSPDFDLQTPEYAYWPEEYDSQTLAEEPVEALPESETEAEIAEVDSEPEAETVDAIDEVDDATDDSEYAQALAQDPSQEWIQRIRDAYPERELFLPSAGDELEEPLPRLSSSEQMESEAELAEAEHPVGEQELPETSLDGRVAFGEEDVDHDVPLISYDFVDETQSLELPLRSRTPQEGAAVAAGNLPVPENGQQEVEANSLHLASPQETVPRVASVPLAQYSDPRPTADLNRVAAGQSVLGSLQAQAYPQVPGEATVEAPLPEGMPAQGSVPEVAHEPSEKTYGIEAGILRLGATNPEIAEADPPQPNTEEAVAESPLAGADPDELIITLEPADFRSPVVDKPEEEKAPEEEKITDDPVEQAPEEPEIIIVEEPQQEPQAQEEPDAVVSIPEEEEDLQPVAEESSDGGDLLVYLEPSSNQPPSESPVVTPVEEQPEQAPVAEEPAAQVPVVATSPNDVPDINWARDNLPLVYSLQADGYYLQVGAYANPRSAKRVIEEVAPGYPLAVLPVEGSDRQLYRVFVGPLNEDEKGMILYWFRARGYRDAFIRKGM